MAVNLQRQPLLRVEDLELAGAPEKLVELIEGELVHMSPAGKFHNRVGWNIQLLFAEFCKDRPHLDWGGDNDGFLVKRNPDTLLCPDASLYVARPEPEGVWLEFAPEIAVEVLSPSNSPAEITFKRRRYFDSGTEQFWLVFPEERKIEIYFRDERVLKAQEPAVVEGAGIAEGLVVDLASVFKLR